TSKIYDTKQSKTSPVVLAPRFASALQLPARVQHKAAQIAWRARKRGLLGKKKPASVAAAALYIACLLEGTPCTQLQIARVAGITQTTVKIRYRDLVKKLKIPKYALNRLKS
ncbi:MAG: transcription initiation factor IIB, partial [Desulfobacterales bacterium]|nr:transcription initiation factor IIB [Desulfobacterales bacterium]